MSSEQRYDYSYGQFVKNDLPNLDLFGLPERELFDLPSLDLSGNSSPLGMTEISSYGLQEAHLGHSHGVGTSFSDGPDTCEQSRPSMMMNDTAGGLGLDTFAAIQAGASNVFTIRDEAATLALGAEIHHSLGDDVQTLDIAAGPSTAQPSHLGTMDCDAPSDPAVFNNAITPKPGACSLHMPRTGPINVSFLFSLTLMRRATDLDESDLFITHTSPNPAISDIMPSAASVPAPAAPTPDVAKEVNSKWSGPQRCHWRGCDSKTTFRSRSSLDAHVRNIHLTPLVCTYPGCPYKKPIGKEYDLKRHLASIHNKVPGYPCLEPGCHEVFFRKDKMMQHAKDKHELFECAYNHCSATVFAHQRELHLRESHGQSECVIGVLQL
ncbi:hypothetical protein CLCR_04957 [Cladophialophora carrionii]|uniref:C2H2-type domain-containing protein n=1 Tax=Cladophialophora carrionii TaxID=86049 RepID=A0A1C1CK61_9EURO|nr:hypothetical protein CLCR_04957 [Cladophialophora carrionii]